MDEKTYNQDGKKGCLILVENMKWETSDLKKKWKHPKKISRSSGLTPRLRG